jgi:hypothetical protein
VKILFLGNFLSPSWDGSIPDEEHIASALEQLGHNVRRWQRDGVVPAPAEIEFSPDFILIAQWDGYGDMQIGIVKEFRKPVIYWAFDHQADGQDWHERLIEASDLYLSKRIADSKYPNWQWLSQDFAPEFLDKYPERIEKDIDVLFTGTYLPWATDRNKILKAVDEKFNLTIHSVNPDEWKVQGFKNVHGPVMDDALPALVARARINLSIDHTLEAGYWSDRNAQIMACGGLVMFKYVPLSKSIFKDHIVYFKDVEDCLWRLGQLLERPQEDLDSVAEGGYRYAHEYMMVGDRVKDLLTIVDDYL